MTTSRMRNEVSEIPDAVPRLLTDPVAVIASVYAMIERDPDTPRHLNELSPTQ